MIDGLSVNADQAQSPRRSRRQLGMITLGAMLAGSFGVAAPVSAASTTSATGNAASGLTALRAKDFVDGIGVNQHLNWTGTPYANASLELKELKYLGVTLVRDAPPEAYSLADYRLLAQAGIRFNFVIGQVGKDLFQTLPIDIAHIALLAQSRPNSVLSVEGPNELNSQIVYLNGSSSAHPSTAADIQRYVSQAVRHNPILAAQNVRVVNVSISNATDGWQAFGENLESLSDCVDFANWHVYFHGGTQPAANVHSMRSYATQSAPQRPVLFTEAGYFTAYRDDSGWGGVDEATQAKNTLNLLFDAFKAGITQTYLYELMDGATNPSPTDIENTWGLFHADGAPKPVATAIHNLTSILDDAAHNAHSFIPDALGYSITGLPASGNSLLLQKANDARFELVVWNEPQNWDPSVKSQIPIAPTSVTVDLGATYGTVRVFDPTMSAVAIATFRNVSTVALSVTDHPLIVEIMPAKHD